ncbi:MAG TPA: acetate kinase [Gordonia sp. (in: high G+C Gram-positive bacteria)]|uniref:acetate kinase n=1 Tax=unclassified Gordonia (in: high G+C Gram-positive bacteria) TaxID=2657482 RepID=UPI0025C463F9|nr:MULTISPECIES: acetate kinase [unclassified Gordonia (in: high G+C Gram-positive bacteria)]HNP57116.1 acetate kinase [Gordonia sp. (in: high G+C Gram-positive bacteria)]HRC50564.1 acetate kinase [Gordonia sp. (in: high G+C Gram-positive bacteria)]
MKPLVLVLNAGSSSLKYQLLEPDSGEVTADGLVERIGEPVSVITHEQGGNKTVEDLHLPDHRAAIGKALELFAAGGIDLERTDLCAVGHRVVHGGRSFYQPTLIDQHVVDEIFRLAPLAPLHNPANLVGIAAARALLPDVPGVAVFDTGFFHGLPDEAALYAIDRQVTEEHALRRYGFHGTSHDYVSHRAAEFLGRPYDEVNQIVAHLGNGASMSAIRHGHPVDTTMGMTPLEGLVMGTRSGDTDPGLVLHLHRIIGLSVDEIDDLLNKRSGLKGLCRENDFRAVTEMIAAGDEHAKQAYDVYIHRLRRYFGAYLIDLGTTDIISFTAGVGENAASVRADSLARLEGFGIEIDAERNAVRGSQPRIISTDASRTTVLVVPTNEELAIAQAAKVVVSGVA